MYRTHAEWVRCPACLSPGLSWHAWELADGGQDICAGVGLCPGCGAWYPIEDGVLDLLTGPLAYVQERAAFACRWREELAALGCVDAGDPACAQAEGLSLLSREQQRHSDWFAEHEDLSYTDFANTPFWRAVDASHFSEWLPLLRPGAALLEPGCAQGRATFAFARHAADIVGFDVSRRLVRQARARQKDGQDGQGKEPWPARMSFMLADACAVPMQEARFDAVLIYGVLHHVPDPALACAEVLRVLRPGGRFFGSENNVSAFRTIFDLLMRIAPLWKEEAGPEALISGGRLRGWFGADSPALAEFCSGTRVFLPPHLVNLFPDALAAGLVRLSDCVGRSLPFFRNNGGLIHVTLRKA